MEGVCIGVCAEKWVMYFENYHNTELFRATDWVDYNYNETDKFKDRIMNDSFFKYM